MTTYQLGIFAIFGGFMMGVILHDEHELIEAWKERIGHFVMVFFLPIFSFLGLFWIRWWVLHPGKGFEGSIY